MASGGDGGGTPPTPDATTASTRPPRPLITPDAFSGDGNWDEWIEHFEGSAQVNGWDDATKLLWLRVRLTGRAQTAWKRLSTEAKSTYEGAKGALRKRFEPDSKRELYAAEFHSRKRRQTESWGDLADDLRILADRAFPELQDEAREKLSLDRYLSQIENSQIAFNVRQQRPKTLNDAVAHTLELESYLKEKPPKVAAPVVPAEVAAVRTQQDTIVEMLRSLTERLDRLEAGSSQPTRKPSTPSSNPGGPIICRGCGQEGHYVRGCAAKRGRPRPGN